MGSNMPFYSEENRRSSFIININRKHYIPYIVQSVVNYFRIINFMSLENNLKNSLQSNMKKHLIFLLLLIFLSSKSFTQIVFENGYFINDVDQKVNCLIKNIDWDCNPGNFEYKLSQDDSVKKADINKIKEFGIIGVSKYIRANVNIDRSSDDISELSKERNPTFHEEELILKVLVEGKASLFMYEVKNIKRFFFKTDNSTINQLVFKRYFTYDNKFAYNNQFRQQLLNTLTCQGLTQQIFERVNYIKRDLEKVFVDYNKCKGYESTTYESKQKKDLFNLSIRPGLNFNSLEIHNILYSSMNSQFKREPEFRLGFEAEFILPYNKNKWGLILEPTYQCFISKNTKEATNIVGGFLITRINYQSIEMPIGIRHYFFLNDNSKIFINASYMFNLAGNSTIDFIRSDGSIVNSLKIRSRNNLAFGLGYKYKNRYGLEMRYLTNREILNDYLTWFSSYKTFSIVFEYTLF
jgi:hypothetical protein